MSPQLPSSIVVVDDDEDSAVLLRELLERRGYRAVALLSADACLEYLRDGAADVVITDIQMPGISGIDLCRELGVRHPDLPAIVLTGVAHREHLVRAWRAGAYDLITKPAKGRRARARDPACTHAPRGPSRTQTARGPGFIDHHDDRNHGGQGGRVTLTVTRIHWGILRFGGLTRAPHRASCVRRATTPYWRPVNPKQASDGQDDSVTRLGDLLYADRSSTIPEQDWARLVAAAAVGNQQALRALYERSSRIVFTLVMRICGHREMAEEVTLDVFHDVWRRSAQYDPKGGTVVGWIMMQARSRALDRLRFEQRKKRVDPHPGRRDEQAEAAGAADAIDAEQRRSSVHAAMTTLTAHERQAIETAFFSELTYSETAARLDEPIGTVKTRVRSALAKLRKALDTTGGRS